MANIDLSNFRVVKTGNADIERNYINDILHALADKASDLQSQIDSGSGGGDATQGSVLTATPAGGNSRQLIPETGVLTLVDNGPGTTEVVGIAEGGVSEDKLDITGTPSSTTVIGDDGSALTYVERLVSVVAGTNITIDATDPVNPIINATGGGGGGSVDSVTDDGNTLVSVDNTDPANPVVVLDDQADQTFIANNSGGSAPPVAISATDATAMLDEFGTFTKGLVPAPGIGTTPAQYLNAAGGFTVPGGGTDTVGSVVGGTGIDVDSTDPNNPIVNLADTAVSPGTYGDSTHYPTFTVDQQGRLTLAGQTALPAGVSGANPTASVGLTAVNGSATTYLRSDGAPALNQGIVPTWTGIHTFTPAAVFTGGLSSVGAIICTANSFYGGNFVAGGGRGFEFDSTGNGPAVTPTARFFPDASPFTKINWEYDTGSGFTAAMSMSTSTGEIDINSGFALTGVVTPSTLSGTGTTNDWNPGVANLAVVRQAISGTLAIRSITGLLAGSAGQLVKIVNISTGSQQIKLLAENTGSSAANRFGFSSDVTLNPKDTISLWYDTASSRWRLLQVQGGTGFLLAANNLSDVSSRTTSFDNVAPTTPTKGDIVIYDGTHWVKHTGAIDGQFLQKDSTQTDGWRNFTIPNVPVNTLEAEITADAPLLWYKLNEAVGATVFVNSGSASGCNATIATPAKPGITGLYPNQVSTDRFARFNNAGAPGTQVAVNPLGTSTPNSSYTVEAVLCYDSTTSISASTLFAFNNNTNGTMYFDLGIANNGSTIQFFQGSNTFNFGGTGTGIAIRTIHVVVVLDATAKTVDCWINGKHYMDTKSFSTAYSTTITAPRIWIGLDHNNANYYQGGAGHLAFYHGTKLTEARILAHAAAAGLLWT